MDPRNPTNTRQSASTSALAMAPPLPHQTQTSTPHQRQTLASYLDLDCLVIALCVCLFVIMSVKSLLYKIPLQVQVQSVTTTTPFTLTSNTTTATTTTTATITAGFNITFSIRHPNYGILYGPANVSVYYHHRPYPHDLERSVVEYYLSSSSLDSFCPGRSVCSPFDIQSSVSVTVAALSVPVSDDFIVFLMNRDLNRRREFEITVKISADSWQGDEGEDQLRVTCKDVRIGVPSGGMINRPGKCKVRWH